MEDTKTILIVEDNPMDRKSLFHILNVKGYHVLEAQNGLEALDILEGEEQSIDLILSDILMPVMDGFSFLRKMKETGMLAHIPVIVMTGENQEKTEIFCLQEGASDFLKKPYHPELVQHRVESILRLWDNALCVSQMETDRLTGVYHKESFCHHAEELVSENSQTLYSMLYLNVEDFKMLNARCGTEAGDALLKFLASVLQSYVGEEGVCGRIGSDIFGAVVTQKKMISQKEAAALYADALQDSPIKGVVVKCGVYPIEDRTLKITDMIDRAKIAEESIKHQYGLYYAVYDDSIRREALREHQLVNSMAESLEKKEFVVYLQPKHSTQTGAVVGAEALVRWIHPELGFISPGEFIPLFERNGFIAKLDYYVWEVVCKTLQRWMSQGEEVTIPISINASRADFLDPDLPEKIVELTQKYEIPSNLIHLEVTESAYTDNPQQIISAVSVLRDFGYQIEMDDFGSGYSSLNMLSELPIDILKLDMRFMQRGSDRLKGSKRNILSFIVSLSKWLQLFTVAEGVETKEEFELLKSMGCNYIQGYYFAKPMPIEEFENYMKKHRTPWADVIEEVKKSDGKIEVEEKEKPLLLVVEDIDSNRKLMKLLLSTKYRVATAENGKVAYEYIKEHQKEISCILLDLLMPVMDGFQLLELLQSEGILKEIPVIITTETGSDSELRALNLGAHSFVAKPYNPNILRHHVRKAIDEKELLAFKREYEKSKKEKSDVTEEPKNREVQ